MSNENQLTCVLNGITYFAFDLPFTDQYEEIEKNAKELGGFAQGIQNISSGGFWGRTTIIIRFMIPESNVIEFSNRN